MGLTAPTDHRTVSYVPGVAGRLGRDAARLPRELGARQLAVADALRHGLLRDRVHGDRGERLRPRALRHGADELLAAAGRRAHLRRPSSVQAGADHPPHLAADAAAQMGHLHGRLRFHRRNVRQLRGGAGNRHDHSRGRLCSGLSAAARRSHLRNSHAPGEGEERALRRQPEFATRWSPIPRASSTFRRR